MGLHGERDVVERGEVAEDAGDLERAREAHARARGVAQARDVGAGEADRAGVGPQLAGELADDSVVLPAPFGPMSAWISPVATSRSTPSVATSAAEALGQPCASRAAAQPCRGLA